MNLFHLASAVVWVDFLTLAVHKFVYNMGNSLDVWYAEFGMTAVLSDCLVIIIGILLAQTFLPSIPLVFAAILVQLVHDVLFYLLVILPVPAGQNRIIDLFKAYATENSWKILAYDSFMIGSTVLLGQYLAGLSQKNVSLVGLIGTYALTYIIYTR
jgi:uncharacterized protein YacL